MLLSLIKNEFIKIFKRSKTWIVFVLFLLFIALTVYGTWKSDKNMREWHSLNINFKWQKSNYLIWKTN